MASTGASLLSAAFVASLCVALLRPAASLTTPAPIQCYNCSESASGPIGECVTNPTSMPKVPCEMPCAVYASYDTNGNMFYTRSCSPFPNNFVGCMKSQIYGCACNTELCNKQLFTAPLSIECYACTSAAYIDNGCGKTLDPMSPFVTTEMGCTACGLDVTESTDGSGYTRSCLMDVPDTNTCAFKQDASNPGCSFRCTTNLCNSANQRGASSSLELALALLVVAALKFNTIL